MIALVTGSSGFVGSHLVDLLLEQGWQVRVLLRKFSSRRWLEGKPLEEFPGDVTDGYSLRAAVPGTQTVFHVAGLIKAAGRRQLMRVNQHGTRLVVEACLAAAPPPRLVLISSAAAQGPSRTAEPLRETDPLRPIDQYGRSKLAGEREALAEASRLQVVVLRPGGIYGPRDTGFLPMFRMARRGWVATAGLRPGSAAIVYVRDVARAAWLAGSRPQGAGVFLVGGDNVEQTDLCRRMGRVLGRERLRFLPLPRWALWTGGALATAVGRLRGKPGNFGLDSARRILARNWCIDGSHAREVLGYQPETTLEEGLRLTAAWYREQGLL